MKNKKYRVSRATLYNTIELLLECSLVRKHQFSSIIKHPMRNAILTNNTIIILKDEVIEFCDPRINLIKETIEDIFDVKIESHSLYFYGKKNKK